MSKATKVKYVRNEVSNRYQEPKSGEFVLKVLGGRGNNLHEAENQLGEKFLISMPTKFRRTIFVKRGSFVFAVPIEEGDKVKAEISAVLMPDDIRNLKALGKWPMAFMDEVKVAGAAQSYVSSDMLPPSDSDSDVDERLESLCINRPKFAEDFYSEDESEEDKSVASEHTEDGQ